MPRLSVYPYKQGSRSAKTLSEALGGRVLKLQGSKYRPRDGDVVINWGSAEVPAFAPARVLNEDVTVAQCKLATLKALSAEGVRVPPFWENADDIPDGAYPVFARTVLRGHSGRGIVCIFGRQDHVAAPLYTKYIKKKHEYRVHVMGGKPFFIQRKARKADVDDPNWMVRNLEGGFAFVETDPQDVPEEVLDNASAALAAVGLDFGGVDVIWNQYEGRSYVLEINTACGLEERTALRYEKAFTDYLQR